jgi:hypothetical protein
VSKNKKLPEQIAGSWPGVLDEIDIQVVPVEYVKTVEVKFDNGDTWVIEIDQEDHNDQEDLENSIETLIEEYQDTIEGVNFILDVEKIKSDITKRTKTFMKKRR